MKHEWKFANAEKEGNRHRRHGNEIRKGGIRVKRETMIYADRKRSDLFLLDEIFMQGFY